MTNKQTGIYKSLRERAEEKSRLDEEAVLKTLPLEDAQQLFHELRVYQIELEMQNEELRRTQHELEVSRSRYFDLYDLAPVGYLTLSEQGLILEVNLAAATMFGLARNSLIKKPLSQFIFCEDQDLYYLLRKKVIETGELQAWEMQMVTAAGSPFWARLQATPAKNGEYWVTLVDISARKQAEEELRKTNELFSLFMKHSPIYAFIKEVTATESRVLQVSDNYYQMIGIKGPEMVGKTTSELFPAEFAEKINADDRAVVSGGKMLELEEEFNGRSYTTIKFPIIQGDKALLAGYTIDITERKLAEKELRESREKFKAYIDNSFDVIFALNAAGVFQFVSRAWERHFGYSFKQVRGNTFADFVHPDDVLPCAEYLAQILKDGESMTSPTFRVKRSDGAWRCFVANGTRYMDANNEWQFIGVAHDITEQNEAKQQLLQAKEAAEAANIAKSEFLATMSHEIRTPLGAMLGNVELLEGSPLTAQQQEYLKDCKSASQMLLQVINDVLDFSKIEAGKLELVNDSFSIASMGQQLVRMFSGTAGQKGLGLTVTIADDLPEYICGDQQRLRQIIANLLSNAIKFTPQGSVSLEICREQAPAAAAPDKSVLRIVVRDTGIGIPDDQLEHIFDSFTQVESFITRSVSGTGLGLPICRRLLALMGGSITASSVPGAGSVFTVVLPVTVVPSRVLPRVQAQVQVQAPPRKILLADDDARGRSVAQKLLQRRGYRVTAVENGAGILETLQQEAFDIVLTDISMPDMEGTQVARIIRSGERPGIDSGIPIIAMTAHAFSDDRARFLAAGINGYVAKPVNLEELFRQIEELCGGGGSL